MFFSKKFIMSLAAVLLSPPLIAGSALAAQRISIGSNPQGSVYYVVGGGLAKLLTQELKTQAIVQPYAGASVYLPLVQEQEVTFGISSSLDSGRQYRGEDGTKLTKLRAIARLWPLTYAYMTRASDGMETIADLKGKRVAVDIRANKSLGDANRAMLVAGGLSEANVRSVDIGGLPQGVQGVADGSLDATAVSVGIPLTREANATIPGGIRYLAVTGEKATTEFLSSRLPGLYMMVVDPSPNRPGLEKSTPITGFDIFLVGSVDLPDATVQAVLKAIRDNFAQLQKDYPVLRSASVGKLSEASNTVPYHPAAVTFFKQAGLWSDANEAQEKRLGR